MKYKGRGTSINPQNRFEKISVDLSDPLYEEFTVNDSKIETQYFTDNSKTVLAKNTSPDVGCDYSINPYRGCEHGCIYCFARPTHEYLGFSSGIDFETKIMVKYDAPEVLAKQLSSKSWKPQVVMFSGNTDCYQPVEKKLGITRRCLEVFLKYRNPVSMITKNALIQRDIDILKQMAELNLVSVTISLTTLKQELQKVMEPRTSSPARRLETIKAMSDNGIPVSILIAPVIPGLNDEEIPEILKSASENGAKHAGRVMLRLPHSLKELFINWLEVNFPEKKNKVINRIREIRDGKLYTNNFGERMNGSGEYAESVHQLFEALCRKYGLNKEKKTISVEYFKRIDDFQIELF